MTSDVMIMKCISVNGISYGEENIQLQSEKYEKSEVNNEDFFDKKLFEDLNGEKARN